jgi:hypothetical protein
MKNKNKINSENYSGDTISGSIKDEQDSAMAEYLRRSAQEAQIMSGRIHGPPPRPPAREFVPRSRASYQDVPGPADRRQNARYVTPQVPRLFIGGIGRDMTSRELIYGFRAFGLEIVNPVVRILQGKSFNFAPDVTFRNLEQYKRAVSMEKIVIKGRTLDIRIHKSNVRPYRPAYDEQFVAIRTEKILQKIDVLQLMHEQKLLESKIIQDKIQLQKDRTSLELSKIESLKKTSIAFANLTPNVNVPQFETTPSGSSDDNSQMSLRFKVEEPFDYNRKDHWKMQDSPAPGDRDDEYGQLEILERSLQKSLENVRKEIANTRNPATERENGPRLNTKQKETLIEYLDKFDECENAELLLEEDPIFEESTGSLSMSSDNANTEDLQHLELMDGIRTSLSQQTIVVMIKSEENINSE